MSPHTVPPQPADVEAGWTPYCVHYTIEQAIVTQVIESQAPWVPVILEAESRTAEKPPPGASIASV